MLKFFVFIVSFLMVLPNLVYATELNCEIKKTGRYTNEYLIKWINNKTIHMMTNNQIVFNNINKTEFLDKDKYVGKILDDDAKRLLWEYKFPSEKVRTYRGFPPRGWHKNDLFIMRFELRKSNNTIFFEGYYKNKKYRWVQGIGKCRIDDAKAILEAKIKLQKLAEEKARLEAQEKEKKLAEEKARLEAQEKEKKLAEEKARLEAQEKEKKLAEQLAREEKEKQEKLERERIIIEQEKIRKAEQEKIKKKSEEVARKKRLKKEKEKEKKLAEEKARKKKLLELERKRKLAQEKFKKQIINYKRKATNFYKDIEDFVKSGADIDLVKLSDYFDIKPNPKNKWGKSEVSQYEQLRNFMMSIPQFASFEKKRIGERLKKTFAMKDKSIVDLNNNLLELKTLMRKMFGSNEFPKIKGMIKDIETTLYNFNQSTANKVLKQSSTYIASKSPKPKSPKKIEKIVSTSDTNWSKLKNNLMIQQQQFCQLTDRFYDNLNKARKSKNEIKVNIVHKERQENLDALIPEGKISNWIFKVIRIDQVEDGSAAVVLGLQCKSYVGSGQTIDIKKGMSKEDKKQWRATIPYNDRRFRELAKLDQGQFIVGSGTMLEINAYKPGQKETFYASQQIGEHPLTKGLNLEGELFITDLAYIAALN